ITTLKPTDNAVGLSAYLKHSHMSSVSPNLIVIFVTYIWCIARTRIIAIPCNIRAQEYIPRFFSPKKLNIKKLRELFKRYVSIYAGTLKGSDILAICFNLLRSNLAFTLAGLYFSCTQRLMPP